MENNNLLMDFILNENDLNVDGIVHLALDLVDPYNGDIRERDQNEVIRNQNYYEVTAPNYTDFQFSKHFRMSRQTFEILLNQIGNIDEENHRIIPLEKKTLFSIWLLSKPESFLAASDRFGLPKSSGHKIFYEIVNLICQLMGEYIRWPQNHIHTTNVFQNRSRGIPGIVGVIDGCHIPIKQPEGNAIDYYNRKQHHSIILQGVCDDAAKFIDVNVGQPGRMHDARVFRLSPLYERLTNDNPLLPVHKHIIGDSAYPLIINLMKPYQDNGHLTEAHYMFNRKLSSVRSTIERAFGLKIKFRRLKYLDMKHPEVAIKIVAAATVLHNFILQQGNPADDYAIDIDIENHNGIVADAVQHDRGPAEEKRQELVNICNI